MKMIQRFLIVLVTLFALSNVLPAYAAAKDMRTVQQLQTMLDQAKPASIASTTAFAYVRTMQISPSTRITVLTGQWKAFGLFIHPGNNVALAQQTYQTFDFTKVNLVDSAGIYTQTVTPVTNIFDAVLQNEICSGPDPCLMRGVYRPAGSFAFASGSLMTPDPPANVDILVAIMYFKGVEPGRANFHWTFNIPTECMIITPDIEIISNPDLYIDWSINVL